jgi:hypothetical protein
MTSSPPGALQDGTSTPVFAMSCERFGVHAAVVQATTRVSRMHAHNSHIAPPSRVSAQSCGSPFPIPQHAPRRNPRMIILQYECSDILTESHRITPQLLRAIAAAHAPYPEEPIE